MNYMPKRWADPNAAPAQEVSATEPALYSKGANEAATQEIMIASDLAGAKVQHVMPAEKSDDLKKMEAKADGKYPFLRTVDGEVLSGVSYVVAQHLIRNSPAKADLLGKDPFHQAQIEQFAYVAAMLASKNQVITSAIFGNAKVSSEAFTAAVKELKEVCKQIDGKMGSYLTGDALSLADISMFVALIPGF